MARGFAGVVRVNKNGNWQMEANFSYADITKDPKTGEKRLDYHPIETGDDFDERGRYRGYIPLGY
ncbi:hypothetical protein O159_19630 [Leifsonia xyli subsp. cynodontis DSM 46306]|uniref:Uncharacterized protein n=1 Tax=Leifsonia xyli subsp. cynodontis DSM 46306 TaxID=1389489 RepID=U3P844_LEIXC|nr:hypothetical protein [Leifsonia xyli]AGW41976.1 hypothetical protein O159_19630 [Leifsonia xyli subsp. cynodontis DSM 46306]